MIKKLFAAVASLTFGASVAFAVGADLPDPSTWTIPDVPAKCFDDKDYCLTDQIYPGPGLLENHIGVQIFMLFERESGETNEELSQRIYGKYMDFDSWDDYAASVPASDKYLKYNRSNAVNDVASAAPFNFDLTNKGFHYVEYKVAGPFNSWFDISGTYEHTLLAQPIDSNAILSASLELITVNRDDNVNNLTLPELMPVPTGLKAPKAPDGVKWHWAYLHILPFEEDEDYVVVVLDIYQQPEISFLPADAVKPIKRAMLAIMGGMLEVDVDFNELK